MIRRMTIKEEIRSLGIDLCNSERTLGAIVRGGLYLDGLAIFSFKPNQPNASIANGILHTRFYPELKLIMTHDPEQRLDFRRVEKTTRLPVLEVRSTTGKKEPQVFKGFRIGRRRIGVESSLETGIVQEILRRTWTTGSLPEPLRVAHLIANTRFLGKNRPFWANK